MAPRKKKLKEPEPVEVEDECQIDAKPVPEVLVAARALISTPDRWTRGAQARDRRGSPTSPLDAGAVAFDVVGAVRAAVGSVGPIKAFIGELGSFQPTLAELWRALSRSDFAPWSNLGPATFNDHETTTHPRVLALFDRALAAVGCR